MLSPETYAHLDHYPIYLQWDAEREEREREREDRMKAAAAAYNIDIHDEDSVWFRDTYTGPSERELMGGCNRCGGMDDCYCMECQTCGGLPCTCPVPDFWQVRLLIKRDMWTEFKHGHHQYFTNEELARSIHDSLASRMGGAEVDLPMGIKAVLVFEHLPGRPCQYCMGKGRVSYGEDEEPVACRSCQSEEALKVWSHYMDPDWDIRAVNRHGESVAAWVNVVASWKEQEQEQD